jgi:hypothetical protein
MTDPSYPGVDVAVEDAEEAVIDPALARLIVNRVNERRLGQSGEMSLLRARYEEIMQWVNPPWNVNTRRIDPRPEKQSAVSQGRSILHVDLVGQTINRWAALEAGRPPVLRVVPKHVSLPLPEDNPENAARNRIMHERQVAVAQNQSTQMEDQTRAWMEYVNFDRTLLWTAFAKNAFGVAVLKDGWDPVDGTPTLELFENPSQVYRGWTRRYGNRKLSWVAVVDEMAPEEANHRFNLDIPVNALGFVDYASWTNVLDQGDMDQRVEQQDTNSRYVTAVEYWELVRPDDGKPYVVCAWVVANRVVEFQTWPWRSLPFHIIENEHIPTWAHGKSTAENSISINEAYDDMLDRQAAVIEFESGPRYMGLNMGNSGDDIDVPGPFELIPLREGEEIRQLDTRVDFFPSQLHANELREASYRDTGLTPIAWGLSARAQTSGRALSTEWRAVELPLTGRLINQSPELLAIFRNWWDYAETYDKDYKAIGKGHRRFRLIWEPLDVRDSTEKTMEVIQKLQANLIDPELAMEMTGIENVDEVMARIKAYLVDPVYNPLRYQQYLILQQLKISIQMQMLQLQQAQGQAQGQQPEMPPPEALASQGENAAVQDAQGQPAQGSTSQNQPGGPGGGGMPLATSILSQTPMTGGVGNRIIAQPGGMPATAQSPSNGQQPR